MEPTLFFVITLMIITLIILVVGILFMAKGGKINKKYSNKLMTARVIFQALAIALLALLFMCSK